MMDQMQLLSPNNKKLFVKQVLQGYNMSQPSKLYCSLELDIWKNNKHSDIVWP